MQFNPLDWFLTALLLYSVVRAALNGFFREAFTLAGLLLGLPLAFWGYHDLAVALSGLLTTAPIAHIVSFFLILAGVTLSASLLGRLLRRGARTVGLGVVDRLGGALFGLLRGGAVGCALLLALTSFLPASPWVKGSLLAPYFLAANHAVSFAMPPDLQSRFWQGLLQLNHSSGDWIKSGPMPHTTSTTLPR